MANGGTAFYGGDSTAKEDLVERVREACLEKGFFQIINHGVSENLQKAIFEQSRDLFSLPMEEKQKYDKGEHLIQGTNQVWPDEY